MGAELGMGNSVEEVHATNLFKSLRVWHCITKTVKLCLHREQHIHLFEAYIPKET